MYIYFYSLLHEQVFIAEKNKENKIGFNWLLMYIDNF